MALREARRLGLTPDQRSRFERDGYLVVDEALDAAHVSRLIDAVDRTWAEHRDGPPVDGRWDFEVADAETAADDDADGEAPRGAAPRRAGPELRHRPGVRALSPPAQAHARRRVTHGGWRRRARPEGR